MGSTGEDVQKLQAKLGLSPDGAFGPVTDARVKEWQAENNLLADGIVGDITWARMFPGSTTSGQAAAPPGNFNLEALRGHIPDPVLAQIPSTAEKFRITSVLRLTHFLAQCSHESGGFTTVFENLNYSAQGLKTYFRKYFSDDQYASYARNPVAIGSRVYANRNGNGNEASGEGYRFRGRGFIQLTGKSNYEQFAAFIGEDTVANPDLVATKYPLASAAFYFDNNHLWAICDQGAGDDTIAKVTIGVNGGTNGLAERVSRFKEYYALLT
jgi:putative chitinase